MALYELRTYTLYVGKTAEALEIYQSQGWPVLSRYADKLVGYFTGDVGGMNEILHLWKYEDDADRRRHWAALFADPDFMAFAARIRPLIQAQQNKLLKAAPFGPHP